MVPFWMPSTTPKAGISSPAACTETSNLPPDIALSVLENISAEPKMVSSDLGKLAARRQRIASWAWTAGAAPTASTPAIPACLMIERRSMNVSPRCVVSVRKSPHAPLLRKVRGHPEGAAFCLGATRRQKKRTFARAFTLYQVVSILKTPQSKRGRGFPPRSSARGKTRSEEHTSELQSQSNLVCRLLLEKKKKTVAKDLCPVR